MIKKAAIVLKSPDEIPLIEEDFIIAADAGYKAVLMQGKKPDVVIGDFDSSEMPTFNNVIKLNIEKDVTDGEECISYAEKNGFNEVYIYGIGGGKIDHQLCNLALLAEGFNKGIKVIGKQKDCNIYFASTGKFSFVTEKGLDFSIIAFGSDALITSGIGCKYPIDNIKLSIYNLGQGISNKAVDNNISFEVLKGNVLVFVYRN